MIKILFATHNQGKIKSYRELFGEVEGLELLTLKDLAISFKVDEPFLTPEENSAHKARTYGELSKMPVLAIDESVTTNFLPDGEQPGVMVRRFRNNRELSDLEILNVWQEVFTATPLVNRQFIWDFRLSYYDPKSRELKTVKAEQIDSVAENFSQIIDPGYPMSSFLIPSGANKTYSELNSQEYLEIDRKNLKPFLKFVREIVK